MVSSVGVAWTRTLRPLTSSIFLISRLEYMLRKPRVASAMTRAPCTVSAIMVLTAPDTPESAIALIRCASERNKKCIDITPACGDNVAAFAEAEMQNSTSPDLTSCSTCGSCPSCAPGYWSISMVPLLSAFGFITTSMEYWMPAFAGMTKLLRTDCRLSLSFAAHEIEIAAFVGLQNGLVEQMRVAALRPFGRLRRHQCGAAFFELGIVDQEI